MKQMGYIDPKLVEGAAGLEVAQQLLIFKGRQLVDGSKLYDSSIFDGAVVHLIVSTRVQPPPQPLPPI